MAAGNTTYEDPIIQEEPETGTSITIEGILDKIAETIITSEHTNITPNLVTQNQKTIRNGIISIGRENSEKLLLFQKDVKANAEDLQTTQGGETLSSIVNIISEFGGTLETTQVTISPLENGAFSIKLIYEASNFDITNILSEVSTSDDGTQTILNPLNISQFINIEQQSTTVNVQKANEFLDTNIYELLPSTSIRQDQINKLFVDINELLPPTFPTDGQYGLDDSDGRINRNSDGQWEGSEQYYLDNSISAPQDNPDLNTIDEEVAYITRLNENANSDNSSNTIESLRDRLNDYLKDVDEQPVPPIDDRQTYFNQSGGYLKFRNLNQGIIIRNTNSNFIEGLNPSNIDYLMSGFTITMWVRFLDKTSQGTLFNFGNPTRAENPFGFKLETYVLNKGDGNFTSNNYSNYGEAAQYIIERDDNYPLIYENSNTARFVRLVVNDIKINGDQILRDSHVGGVGSKLNSIWVDENSTQSQDFRRLQTTFIPEDFQEWYFICASFNPIVDEDNSFAKVGPNGEAYDNDANFWLNHINPDDGLYTINSDYGNRCKVEIISRADLLRARGFKL